MLVWPFFPVERIRFDTQRIKGPRQMKRPTAVAELQQFFSAIQWMRNEIPIFSTTIRPLLTFLEKVYQQSGKRRTSDAGRVCSESIHCGEAESDDFHKHKEALGHQITPTHRDVSLRLCRFTDASDYGWSDIVTKVALKEFTKLYT